jgi:hypothetical protein
MTLDEADVIRKEAFQRWVGAKDDAARRVARRDLDAANVAWDAAWEKWARKVGLKA